MKVRFMRHTTLEGPALYAILKEDIRTMEVIVPDSTPESLRGVAREMRAKLRRDLKRIQFIEAAAAELEANPLPGETVKAEVKAKRVVSWE
jgi:hypothetical protein